MAYISNSRQRIADIIQGTIARDTRSPEGSGASKPFNRNHPAHPDYVNPNKRREIRESGQPHEPEFPMDEGGQFRLPLAQRNEPLKIAREYRFSDPRSGNPLSIMHHQSGKTSVEPGTPEGTRYYWDGGEVPPTDIPSKINPFPGAMIEDNDRIIPEDPGNIVQREGPGGRVWDYITPPPPAHSLMAGIYSSNKSGDTDEVWEFGTEDIRKRPFVSGPESRRWNKSIQDWHRKKHGRFLKGA